VQKLSAVLLFLIIGTALHAGSLRLVNNSPYDLRAVIRGSDGSFLGEVVVRAQNTSMWSDTYSYGGMYSAPNAQAESGYRSITPYTILWYCMDGGDYGVCDQIATGGLVMAQGCPGSRQCKPQKKGGYPQQPEGQYLHPGPPSTE